MPRRKQSRGKCAYCGQEMVKGGVSKHLAACPQRQGVIAEAEAKPGETQRLYHLRVQDAYGGQFWLDLEMNGDATLKQLDSYLRAIWLECCGHLSEFFIGGAWSGRKAEVETR